MQIAQKLSLTLLLVGLGISTASLAQGQWFVQGSGAYVMAPEQNTTVTLGYDASPTPLPILENYKSTEKSSVIDASLGFGYRSNFNAPSFLARNEVSLNYLQNTSLKLQGQAMRVDTQHIGENYQYNIDTRVAMLEDRLYFNTPSMFKPFVLAGVGMAQLNAHNFSSQPTDSATPIYSNDYADQSKNKVVFEMGAGVAADLSKHVSVSLAYRYLDFGLIETGNAANQDGSGATLGGLQYNMKTSSIMLGLNYYF